MSDPLCGLCVPRDESQGATLWLLSTSHVGSSLSPTVLHTVVSLSQALPQSSELQLPMGPNHTGKGLNHEPELVPFDPLAVQV